MNFRTLPVALAMLLVASATPAFAHHSFSAEFDAAKPLTIEGVVKSAKFVNPHSWIYVVVKNKDGSTDTWGLEFGTPTSLRANGIQKADVAAGTPVKLRGFRARNGGKFGYATTVILPSGREIKTGGAPNAPAQAAP